ncbi:adenylate kinase [Solibacillus sp. CAU 1738]|uniref:adenylate kinase n=1 Tax=Solibacillus sp. CAU 1738 TaxID=3140363 RepID=UPI0032619AC6
MRHKRILIIGSSGAGKSTLARILHQQLGLPLVHLDQLYWQPGWVATEKPVFREKMLVELEKPEWIMDGNFDSTLGLRAQYADLIILLNYPKYISFTRAMKRYLIHIGHTREDMTPGCQEQMDWEFAKWIWTYNTKALPPILQFLSTVQIDSVIINHPKQLKKWLKDYCE